MHKHRKYKIDELDDWEKDAFIEERKKIYLESIERIRVNGGYTNREMKEFISFSNKFDNPTAAISLLHNCHVMRINNEYDSDPVKIVVALKAGLRNDFRVTTLEKAVELLSDQPSYVINFEELEKKKNERKNKARPKTIDLENEKKN